jgi:hypothetical protein
VQGLGRDVLSPTRAARVTMLEMITAGGQTKLAVQWAAKLAPNTLLIPYKNALVYIDQRGWFNNTFETESALEGEVQHVLDLRVAFGEEP